MATPKQTQAEKVLEQIIRARISLLLQQPFWGTLATRLILKDATDTEWCTTAATDGRYFYYNCNFMEKLNKAETIFLVAHEVEHCVYDHMSRRGSRLPKMWNAAADFVINYELDDHKIGKIPDPKTSGVHPCFDAKYKGMFAEEVYEMLINDPKGGSYGDFDIHLEPGDGKGEPMTEEERRVLGDEIRAAVMQAAKAAGAGNTPAGVKRMLKDLTEPQMDWREILNMKIRSMLRNDFTWMRCSRKAQASGFYLPGQKDDVKVEACVAIDCSGSMSDEMLRDLLSEVKGIMEQFMDFKLRVWCFDTRVYSEATFTPENLDEIDEYDIKGGGGTDFMCNWEYMKENDIQPERFIMMTDGYPCGSWGDENWCDTLFLIHGDTHRKLVAPFGMTAWYEPDSRSPQNRK
jgi:predicted metal-dependent peptidase